MITKLNALIVLLVAALCVSPLAAQDNSNGTTEAEKALKELCSQIRQDAESATEGQVIGAIDKAAELGHPYAVAQTLQRYLVAHPKPSAALWKKAIDNALLIGDFNAAMVRCKAYLKAAKPGAETSQVAATLYRVQIDLLGIVDDAYRTMSSDTDDLCRGLDARKFDAWYLAESQRRRDYVNLARRLAEIHAAGLALLQTQHLCASAADELLAGISTPSQDNFAAVADVRRLAASIRDDDRTKLRCALYAANLAFGAAAEGKTPEQLEKDFAPVLAAANAYLAKYATAETVSDEMFLFGGGRDGRNHGHFFADDQQGQQKRAFFVAAFARLPDAERKTILSHDSVQYFATTAQWMELAAKYATAFHGSPRLNDIPFDMRSPDAAAYKRLAPAFEGSQSEKAVTVRSLAASADFNACMDHLILKEAWDLDGYNRAYVIFSQHMWPSYQVITRDEQNQLPGDFFDKAMLRFGAEHVIKTPLALDDWTTREYLTRLWSSVRDSAADMPQMAACLQSLLWVPYSEEGRTGAFNQVYTDFKKWTNETRKAYGESTKSKAGSETKLAQARQKVEQLKQQKATAAANNKDTAAIDQQLTEQEQTLEQESTQLAELTAQVAVLEKQIAQISPLEAAFKRVIDAKSGDPDRAPNALCKELTRAVIAARSADNTTFIDAARRLYPMVKNYDSAKTPLGRTILKFLVSPSPEMDVLDFQLEALADQLAGYAPNSKTSEARVRMVATAIATSHKDWDFGRIPAADKEKALKLNAAFAKALSAQINGGQISSWLFDAVRGTRRGSGWGDSAEDRLVNEDLIDQMIQKKTLQRSEWRALGISAATNYMALVRSEFPSLREKYPPESYFDDMLIEEATRVGFVDDGYFSQDGRDNERKIRNLAAKLISEIPAIPIDGRGPKLAYNRTQFFLMQSRALDADPAARNAMLAKIESYYGKSRFDDTAKGLLSFDIPGDINDPEFRKWYFARLETYLGRAAAAPTRMMLPNLAQVVNIQDPESLTDAELDVLLRIFSPQCLPADLSHHGRSTEGMALRLIEGLVARERQNDLFTVAPHLWKIATIHDSVERKLVELVATFQQEGKFDLAGVYSGVGLDLFDSQLQESNRNRLRIARSQALVKVDGLTPVDQSDPRYPILAAQSDFLSGNLQQAWQNYLGNRDLAVEAVSQLQPAFCIWLIQRNTDLDEFDTAEELAREALQWMESEPDHFLPDARARLLLAYANIVFQRPEYPRARALYERIAAAEEFTGTRAQLEAELQIAEVDRATKHYGEAIERLEKILTRKDRFARCEGHYYLARVLFDQEQYVEALDEIEQVFSFDPTHADARIFEGRINLQIKRLERASRIKVGFSTDQEYIVAGKPLRISLQDQTLSVAGNTMVIEMRVWAESGDEEFFNLVPFADSKTQFEGQIITALGPVAKGDHVLQVLGNDRVYYDFSEQFKLANNVEGAVDHSLDVISDSDLYASSGKILSKAEMEEQALQRMLRARLKMSAEEQKEIALGDYRPQDQIKPGNPVNIRVIDSDQSVTDQKDKLTVALATTSGDAVTIELEETDTHSGTFDGVVPTASASAMAFASDSEQGSQPVFAISAGDHPAWVAQPDNIRPKTFSVDLNASEKLEVMKIVAAVPGRKIKQFLLQTSTDGKEFETIGSWPSQEEVWDGAPRVVRMVQTDPRHSSLADIQQDLGIAPPNKKTITKLERLGAQWKSGDSPELAHFMAAFHLPTRQMTTLQLQPKTASGQATYVLLVDGQQARTLQPQASGGDDDAAAEPALEFKSVLGQGVHRIDVYVRLDAKTAAAFETFHNVDEPPYLEICPADMFDPETHPMIATRFAEMAAEITAAEDGGSFDVAFGPAVRARVVRLLLADFETDAPAINKIHVSAQDDRELLPTKVDLLALRTNGVLEIVPGDKVSVVYKDPRCITKEKKVREAFLSATYTNGTIDAALLTGYDTDSEGMRHPNYIGLRRFKPEDTICVIVDDADADTSGELDTVSFTARTGDGQPVELKALETAEHSGVFLGKVFVVEGEPQRASELKVAEGEDLIFSYTDQENTDPGIPWERTSTIESVVYFEPEFRVFNVESSLLSDEEIAKELAQKGSNDYVPASRTLAAVRPIEADGSEESVAVMGVPLIAELVWPTIAQTTASTAEIYVQTSAGRKTYGKDPEGEFDVNVPGTIKIEVHPGSTSAGAAPPGYRGFMVVGDPNAMDAMDDGRFTFSVPMRLAELPEVPFVVEEEEKDGALTAEEKGTLVVRGDDEIFIGFKYTNDLDESKWITRKVRLTSDAFFNAMDRQYRQQVEGVYVGESAHFRVIHPARDLSDDRDRVTVEVESASGDKQSLELTETFEHSGIFKGPVKFAYADDSSPAESFGAVRVKYGEQVTAAYQPEEDAEAVACSIEVFKGSDGEVQPFTKRFEDPLMAVRTRLTIAESYFELAKKHRRMGEDELTEQEIATGKRLLEEALRDYPDTEARAQVDYLLANLSLEFAEEADEEDAKKKHYFEALSRFAAIVSTYRDSTYAPKAQYKKALTLEKMGEIDRACEEYVKLSYRWPDDPLIAETIARLGQYFLHKGKGLSATAEETEDPIEAEKARMEAAEKYVTAGKVFSRLAVRFPAHKLADKTTAVSAQCFLRAKEYDDAIAVFKLVYDKDTADKELRAESLYWAADCFMRKAGQGGGKNDKNLLGAYRLFKRIHWDYPESKWARFARGRLAGEQLAMIDAEPEEKRK